MFLGPIRNPDALRDRVRWWILAYFFLFLGLALFVIFAYIAFTGIINCGRDCVGRSALDIFFGEAQYLATLCIGFILMVIGATIFGIYRWGMFLEGRHWREPYQRKRHP